MEAFKARSLEVLFLCEPIDEYLVGNLTTYQEKELVSIDKSGLELEKIDSDGEGLDEKSFLAARQFEWLYGHDVTRH